MLDWLAPYRLQQAGSDTLLLYPAGQDKDLANEAEAVRDRTEDLPADTEEPTAELRSEPSLADKRQYVALLKARLERRLRRRLQSPHQ